MREEVTQSDYYSKIGRGLIDQFFDDLKDIDIGFLESSKAKKTRGRIVFGDCRKVPDRDRWAIPYDFLITVYTPNVEEFTEEQKMILIKHELMHIGKDKLVPHDIEDFRGIIEEYGLDWSE